VGQSLVEIEEVWTDAQQLRHGRVKKLEETLWSEQGRALSDKDVKLSDALKKVYSANPELNALYPLKRLDDALWVASRWLEILPVSIKQKENVLLLQRFEQIQDFLHTLIVIE
jgi:hypothetical protein